MEGILAGNDPVNIIIGDIPFAQAVYYGTELDAIFEVFIYKRSCRPDKACNTS